MTRKKRKLDVRLINWLPDMWPWANTNWRNFCLVTIDGEVDTGLYGEVRFVVLGLGFAVEWWYEGVPDKDYEQIAMEDANDTRTG